MCFKYIPLLLLVVFLFSRCATPGIPTGGTRDTTPPKVQKQFPGQNATNVETKKLVAEFDEFVQVKNPNQGVLVSPPPTQQPEIKVKRNVLTIEFKDSLLANTTYSLQFGDNLQDVNEANPLSNFTWVFSTGDHIDSLSLTGKVGLLGINEIPENTWVVLYKNLHDTAFTSERPYYFSKVEKGAGTFKLNNLKEGLYRIFVLEDRNGNYYYDLPIEKIGFSDSALDLSGNLELNTLRLFDPEPDEQYLVDYSTSIKNNSWQAKLAKPTDNWSIKPITDSVYSRSVMLEDKRTVQTWVRASPKITTAGWEIVADSMRDTVYVSMIIASQARGSLIRGQATPIPEEPLPASMQFIIGDTIFIPQPVPVIALADTGIVSQDTAGVILPFEAFIKADSLAIAINASLPPGNYELVVPPAGITSFTGGNPDSLVYRVSIVGTDLAGSLVLNMEFPADNQYVVSVMNEQGVVVWHEIVTPFDSVHMVRLDTVLAGRYTVRVIEDVDKNGVLTRGSYFARRQPERLFVSSPVELKAGWEQESMIKIIFD